MRRPTAPLAVHPLALGLALAIAAAPVVAPAPARAFWITTTFDTSITNRPDAATVMATINTSVLLYASRIQGGTTVNIQFQNMNGGLGASSTPTWKLPYAQFVSALQTHASSVDDATVLSHLPGGPHNPVTGNDSVFVSNALARELGMIAASPQAGPAGAAPFAAISAMAVPGGSPEERRARAASLRERLAGEARALPASALASSDGTVSINLGACSLTMGPPPADKYTLSATVWHEVDEVLGFGSGMNGLLYGQTIPQGPVYPHDLFRYREDGTRSYSFYDAGTIWCSFDGVEHIANFNNSNGGDFSDWGNAATPAEARPQDAFGTAGTDPQMGVEWRLLDAIGWSLGPPGQWVDFYDFGVVHDGHFATPWNTLAAAAFAAPDGGTILIKGNAVSFERPTLTRPVTITTVGGSATIGQ